MIAVPGILNSGKWPAFVLLALGQTLCGLGSAPLYIVAPVYFGRIVTKKRLPGFLGTLYAMAGCGPAVGFLGEGLLVDAVGWWPFFLIFAMLGLLMVRPILLAPSSLAVENEEGEEEPPTTPVNSISSPVGLLVTGKVVVGNHTWVLSTLAAAVQVLMVAGLTVYIPKYVHLTYGLSPGLSAILVGACVVPGCAGGMMLGSQVINWMGGSERSAMRICVISTFSLVPCCAVWKIDNMVGFFVMLTVTMVCIFSNHVPNTHILLNILSASHQGTGMGLQNLAHRVLGSIPGPVLFGAIIDKTCIEWGNNCLRYDIPSLRNVFTAMAGGLNLTLTLTPFL